MGKGSYITQVPLIVPGCVIRAHAPDLTTITSSGGLVSKVRNKANVQNPFAQATASRQPTTGSATIGNLNAFGFDGSNDALVATASEAINNIFVGGGTAVFVANVLGMGGLSVGRLFDKSGVLVYCLALSGSTCKLNFTQVTSGTPGGWATTNSVITLGQPFIFAVTYDSSSVGTAPKMYINSTTEIGVSVTSVPTGSAQSDAAGDLVIGNRSSLDRAFDGYIAEVNFFRKVLSSEERTLMFRSLSNEYGIAIS